MDSDAGSVESGLREKISQLARENGSLRTEVENLRRDLITAQSTRQDLPPAYEIGVFAEPYMEPRLREEICRAGRYRHYLSMVVMQLIPRSRNEEKSTISLPKEYAHRMRNLLRATDILFLLGDNRLSIILPETSETETTRVVDRLQSLVDGQVKMACATASYPHDANHEGALIAEAFERLDRLVASWKP